MKCLYLVLLLFIVGLCRNSENRRNFSLSETIYGPFNSTDYEKMHQTFEQFQTFLKLKENEKYIAMRNNHTDSLICKACLWTFNHVYDTIHKYYGKIGLFQLLTFICDKLIGMTHTTCYGYINSYGPVIFDSLIDHYLTGEYICTVTHACKDDHFIVLDADDYARKLLADKPVNISRPQIDETAETWKVLHVTDIHTDTKYVEGSRGVCPDPLCCRSTSFKGNFLEEVNAEGKAGKWGFPGKCDLPLRTLLNFIDTVVRDIKPDFIIWTGDNPSHAEWEADTQEEVYNVTSLFTYLLKEKFNNTVPVYPSLGNHEKFPADQFFPYGGDIEGHWIKFFADLWKDWLGEESYQQFLKTGFYSKKHLDTNLRIVSYNCLYCDVMDFYLLKDPTDPSRQINWLEITLRQAEKNGEVVYLVGHIPAGDTSLLSECAKRFKALVDRFSHIILGQFSGHTHFDEVKILHNYFQPHNVSGVAFIAPSLTRVFKVDSKSKLPKDYLQYRLNLTEANLSSDDPVWKVSYRASEFFNVKYLNEVDKINEFVLNIEKDNNIYTRMCRAFFADGPQIEVYYNNPRIPKYLSCRFKKDIFDDFFDCINWKTWNTEEFDFKVLNYLGGKWYLRLPDH